MITEQRTCADDICRYFIPPKVGSFTPPLTPYHLLFFITRFFDDTRTSYSS